MSLNIPSNVSFPARVNTAYQETVHHPRKEEPVNHGTDAYVNKIDKAAVAKLMDNLTDAPFSDAELEQLISVSAVLESDHPLWKEIAALLSEFNGKDRANFLSVLSKAGSNLEAFVNQVKLLEGKNQSVYLTTAVRIETGTTLENLITAVKNLSDEHLTGFLNMTDVLGRSFKSIEAEELQNFIAAAAASPLSIDKLTQTTEGLVKEDRAAFLKAAAGSGRELNRLIKMTETLSGSTLALFLTSAAEAGEGLKNLLDLTENITGEKRQSLLNFTSRLSGKNTENFLLASQGLVSKVPRLMETAQSFTGDEKSMFLSLVSSDLTTDDRLMAILGGMDSGTGERSDFLSSALRAKDGLTSVLKLAETTHGSERAELFSFTADLSLADQTNFFSAVQGDPVQARELAASAEQLDGKNKSYLLYAASLSPENISELITISRKLTGAEQDDFLFISANIDPEADGAMDRFLSTVEKLEGRERADFLTRERADQVSAGEGLLAGQYVYLKSVFDEHTFQGLINAGERVDLLINDFESLDDFQQTAFLSVAAKAEKEVMPELLSVTARLDETGSKDFTEFSGTMNKTGLSDLIRVADRVLDGSDNGSKKLSQIFEISKTLDNGLDEKFLSAAAGKETDIDRLIYLTDQLGGIQQVNFLVAADYVTRRGDDGKYTENFFRGTELHLNAFKKGVMTSNDTSEGIRPSQFTTDTGVKGFSSARLGFYLESAAYIRSGGIRDELRKDWYRTW